MQLKFVVLVFSSITFCSINAMTQDERLITAAKRHDINELFDALEKKANVNAIDELGRTALMYASDCWFSSNIIYKLTHRDKTLLNQTNIVKILLRAGADVNVTTKDKYDQSAIKIACYGLGSNSVINRDVIKLLVAFGADENEVLAIFKDYPDW
jgi:ankyrin repeat protein